MKKGFTLLELLIVIGIIAILASVVALVLNPAELLRQARDGQRISDFDTLRTAINYHLSTGTLPDTNYNAAGTAYRRTFAAALNCPFATSSACTAITTTTSTAVGGTGWVNVNFNDVGGGSSPLSVLPIDPTNNTTYYYAYAGEDVSILFELNGRLESTKYRIKMTQDGGNQNTCSTYIEDQSTPGANNGCYYEVGTSINL